MNHNWVHSFILVLFFLPECGTSEDLEFLQKMATEAGR